MQVPLKGTVVAAVEGDGDAALDEGPEHPDAVLRLPRRRGAEHRPRHVSQRLLCTHATTLQSHSLQELSSLKSPHMDNDIPSLFRPSLPELPSLAGIPLLFDLQNAPFLPILANIFIPAA